MTRWVRLTVCCLLAVLAGCVTRTDYYTETTRPTDATAYSLARKETRVGVGVVGHSVDDFGANLEVGRGFGPGFHARFNVAHALLGAYGARLKWNFLDRPRWALSGELGAWWLRPSFLRVLPAKTRQDLEGLDIVAVPLTLTASVPMRYWGLLSLGATYHHTELIGELTDDSGVIYDGLLTVRRFELRPTAHFYVGNVVVLFVGAALPPWAVANLQTVVTEPVQPGIEGGIRSNQFEPVPFSQTFQAFGGAETQFGPTHLRLYVAHNFFSRTVGVPVLPGADLYWRF